MIAASISDGELFCRLAEVLAGHSMARCIRVINDVVTTLRIAHDAGVLVCVDGRTPDGRLSISRNAPVTSMPSSTARRLARRERDPTTKGATEQRNYRRRRRLRAQITKFDARLNTKGWTEERLTQKLEELSTRRTKGKKS